jgi:hypothetical protein
MNVQLTEQEKSFFTKREKLVRAWPLFGSVMLIVVLCLAGWLFWRNPLLVNPWVVLTRLEAGSIPDSTLLLMAGLLPIAMLLCLAIVLVTLLFAFVALSNERKYISIIHRLLNSQD